MANNKKKRSLPVQEEDGNNTIHAADAKKQKQQGDNYVLSKHEDMLLSIHNVKIIPRNLPRFLKGSVGLSVTEAMSFIRPAYCSVRTTDMAKLFKDKTTVIAMITLANLFRKMRRFSLCMRALRTDLLTKLKLPLQSSHELPTSGINVEECSQCSLIHPQASLTHPRRLANSGHGDRNLIDERGRDQFSIKVHTKVHNMLLILDEMLIQMGIDPENVQGYEDSKLAGMVEHRMILLRTEMEKEESLLIKLIDSKRRSKFASFSDKLRHALVSFLWGGAMSCRSFVLSANKEKHPSLDQVSEFIWGMVSDWHSKGRKPIPNKQAESQLRNQLDLKFERERYAELGS